MDICQKKKTGARTRAAGAKREGKIPWNNKCLGLIFFWGGGIADFPGRNGSSWSPWRERRKGKDGVFQADPLKTEFQVLRGSGKGKSRRGELNPMETGIATFPPFPLNLPGGFVPKFQQFFPHNTKFSRLDLVIFFLFV